MTYSEPDVWRWGRDADAPFEDPRDRGPEDDDEGDLDNDFYDDEDDDVEDDTPDQMMFVRVYVANAHKDV